MTKLEQLKELQARLDKATGGSRDIDFLLAPLFGYVRERRNRDKKEWWYLPDNKYHRHSCDYNSTMPRFSSSIDSAVTWVEKMGFSAFEVLGFVVLENRTLPANLIANAILKAAVAALIERCGVEA